LICAASIGGFVLSGYELTHLKSHLQSSTQMINVWFSYAGKIRQMRGTVTGTDFGVSLEEEAQRLRAEQKAKVG